MKMVLIERENRIKLGGAQKPIDPSIFSPSFASVGFANSDLFNKLLSLVKEFMASPDDMALRVTIRRFCEIHSLEKPNFPALRAEKELSSQAFIPLFKALENPNFQTWFIGQRTIWHTHKGINEFHLSCACAQRKEEKEHLHCPSLRLDGDSLRKVIQQSIASRGRFFVHSKRLEKCFETKIEIHKGLYRFIQNVGKFGYVYLETSISAEGGREK